MPGHLRRLLRQLSQFVRPGKAERDLDREISSHLALLEDEFQRRGLSPDEARRAARRAFGSIDQTKDYQRDARSVRWLEDARRDIGYAARTLRKTPGFTLTAVLTLALGIGAVTVIYSLLRNVLLDPFPYANSDRMVDVILVDASDRIIRGPSFASPEFLDYQEQTSAFEDVIGTSVEPMLWTTESGAERLFIAWMTPNGFNFLGVAPHLGRAFGAADAAPGAPPVGVLNHRTWMTLFGGDPSVIGRSIVLNNEPRTIVGIMPPRFEWNIADLWIPGPLSRSDDPQLPRSRAAFQARLRPGVSIKEAEAQLDVVAARRAAQFPRDYPPHSRMKVITVIDWVVGRFRGVLYTLFAAVGLLLLIACCNVANMLLARATVRQRELAVRAALGASRGRILRQLLAESAMLAAGGAVAGCALAYAGIKGLARLMPRQGIPWETELRLDQPVLIFALATAVFSTLLFGLLPALQSARRDLIAAANSSGRSGTGGRQQTRMRGALVIAEVALSIVLLAGSGLLARSFLSLVSVDLGLDPENVLITGLVFPPTAGTDVDRRGIQRQALDRIHTIPGVRAAMLSNGFAGGMDTAVEVAGAAPQGSPALVQFCSEELIETLGLRLVAGRPMSALEVTSAHKVALVSQKFVSVYFNGGDPIGRTVRVARVATLKDAIPDPSFTIVGVVSDVANQGPQQPSAPQIYIPNTIRKSAGYTIVVRTHGDPLAITSAVRREVSAVDRQIALWPPISATQMLDRGIYAQPRFSLIVLGMFGVTGVLLVALGVYGVLAYTVSQRSQEIAIRMALGGERGHVLRLVFRMGLRLVGIGLVVGFAASLATNRLLVNQLWQISPHDPITLAGAVGVVLTIGLCACWVPARRAIRVEPIAALRHE